MQGVQGRQGTQGTRGLQGLQGVQGVQGRQGTQGTSGPNTTINATDTTAAGTYYPVFVAASGTNQTARVRSTATAFSFNPGTGEVAAVDFNSLSDINMKTDIQHIEHALDKVQSLRGVHFRYKDTGRPSVGIIAQDLEPVLPDLVKVMQDGTKSVAYNGLIALMIEAIKDQQAQIVSLRDEIKNVSDTTE